MQDGEEAATAAVAVSGKPVHSERGWQSSPAQGQGDGGQAGGAGERYAGQGQGDGGQAGGAGDRFAAPGQGGRAEARGTGDPRVDQAIAALDGLAGLPPEEHVAVFEDIHGKLRQVLSELDSGPADSGAAGR